MGGSTPPHSHPPLRIGLRSGRTEHSLGGDLTVPGSAIFRKNMSHGLGWLSQKSFFPTWLHSRLKFVAARRTWQHQSPFLCKCVPHQGLKNAPGGEGLAMVATVTALPEAVALSSERALPHKTPRTKTCFFGPIQMSLANLALEERGTGNWGSIG